MPDQPGVSDGSGVAVYRMETGDFFRFDGRKPWDIPNTATMGKWFPTDAQALADMRERLVQQYRMYAAAYPKFSIQQLADVTMREVFGDAARGAS